MNFYKRHIGDYIKATSHLSLLEHGIYNRLLDVYYTRESGIPEDRAARLIGARTPAEKQALQSVLSEFFTLAEGEWRQTRCDEEIRAANEKAERNREVGKKGGRPRKVGSDDEPKNNPDGFCGEPKNNPSQTPVTSNQKEEESQSRCAAPVIDLDPRKQIFDLGKTLLGKSAVSLISKAISEVGEEQVGEILGHMAVSPKADPRTYFAAATKPKERGFVV